MFMDDAEFDEIDEIKAVSKFSKNFI